MQRIELDVEHTADQRPAPRTVQIVDSIRGWIYCGHLNHPSLLSDATRNITLTTKLILAGARVPSYALAHRDRPRLHVPCRLAQQSQDHRIVQSKTAPVAPDGRARSASPHNAAVPRFHSLYKDR